MCLYMGLDACKTFMGKGIEAEKRLRNFINEAN